MIGLVLIFFCLYQLVICQYSVFAFEFEGRLSQAKFILPVWLSVWCSALFLWAFTARHLLLSGLLVVAVFMYFMDYDAISPMSGSNVLLAGVTLGQGVKLVLQNGRQDAQFGKISHCTSSYSNVSIFLSGLVLMLAAPSWLHLNFGSNFYLGPRWMGLWNNPNDYGVLMSAGVVLATGLLAVSPKSKVQSPKSEEGFLRSLRFFATKIVGDSRSLSLRIVLFIAAGMMGVGLVFSYSRGAWVGTAIGLLYLAKGHGKLKWRWFLPGVLAVTVVAWIFWNTPRTGSWYFQRLDLSRGSVQHRVAAWKAGLEIMRDHPFGLGWNKAVETYNKEYSPPEDGAAAIATNDYLMLGTQLGIPGLVCFLAYVALCFRSPKSKVQSPKSSAKAEDRSQKSESKTLDIGNRTLDSAKAACRAGALALLVAFWFDGGLFKLATAAVFWILLELGTNTPKEGGRMKKASTVQKSKIKNQKLEMSSGFTLIEMLVCIAIIGILAALLLSAMAGSKESAERTQCRNNLRQIGIGMTAYATDNDEYVISARRNKPDDPSEGSFVQICLDPQTAKSTKTVGLEVSSSNHLSVWTCPDRPGLPLYEKTTKEGGYEVDQWIIGYQYFGGITNWVNPSFPDGIPSRSPVRLAQSKPTWCLAADTVIKAGRWGAVSTYHPGPPFENMPPHGKTTLEAPPGGNELFVDGSTLWINFEQMYFLTTWKGALDSRQAFLYQETSDFEPALVEVLPKLAGPRFK